MNKQIENKGRAPSVGEQIAKLEFQQRAGCMLVDDADGVMLSAILQTLRQHDALVAALEHFARLPIENFGWERKTHDYQITGFNSWNLNVGHIRAARAALAGVTKEPR